jgi:dTDP-4-dehydrorhamnose reductase
LGRALVERLGAQVCWAGGREALDIRDAEAVARVVADARPELIVNAAAFNAVDAAEQQVSEALAVNAAGPAHLAQAARAAGALLVHVSTDYVFDGQAGRPYSEDDRPRPLSAYGASKLAGELLVAASGAEHLMVRTSGVFGAGGSRAKGGSFVDRILARARAGQALRVVADQVFSPTYAPDLAAALLALTEAGARGLFHVANAGSCSWHALAVEALRIAGIAVAVAEIRSSELKAPAARPAASVLSSERYRSLGLAPLRSWQAALAEHLA